MSTQRKKSAPTRSILLMKHMRGTSYLLAWRQTVSVCGSTPATASNTATAPSRTRSDALDLDREVDVAGRVDDVDPRVAPLAGGGGARDRDAALLLLDHPVHDRRALVDLTDLVGASRVVEDPLGRRGLAGVDVRHDPDVAHPPERNLADDGAPLALDFLRLCSHVLFPLPLLRSKASRARPRDHRVVEPRASRAADGGRCDRSAARSRGGVGGGRRRVPRRRPADRRRA